MRHLLIMSFTLAACASTPSPQPGQAEHKMQNCPTALVGATTRAINTVRGVDLEITARDPEIQREIVELARFHASIGDPTPTAQHHTGMHGGPGDIGYCPIIHNATTVSFTKLANGAVIHVNALPDNVTRLQATVAERIGRLAAH